MPINPQVRRIPPRRRPVLEALEPRALLALSTTAWTPLGPAPINPLDVVPGPIAGRINCVLLLPGEISTALIGTDRGGIWKTTSFLDFAPGWTPLTDFQPSTMITEANHNLVLSPFDAQTIYVTADGAFGGVLVSHDLGDTWTLNDPGGLFTYTAFGALAASPNTPQKVYVAVKGGGSAAGGVYESTDDGATWRRLTLSIPGSFSVSDLDIATAGGADVLYATVVGSTATNAEGNGVWTSSDGGNSWSHLNTGGIPFGSDVGYSMNVAIAPSDPATVYVTVFTPTSDINDAVPRRYRTDDSGQSWSHLPQVPVDAAYPVEYRSWHQVLAVDPEDPQVVYANGSYTVFQSADGGQTWGDGTVASSIIDPGREDPIQIFFDAQGALVLVGDRGINRQLPGTDEWVPKAGDLQNAQFYNIAVDPFAPQTVYGIAQDQLRFLKHESDADRVWQYLVQEPGENGTFQLDPNQQGLIYVYTPPAFRAGRARDFLYRSENGGSTWTPITSGIDPSEFSAANQYNQSAVNALAMDPTNTSRLIMGAERVYGTTDRGDHWTPLHPTALSPGQYISAVAIAPSLVSTLYAATADGKVFVSTNSGAQWSERGNGLGPAASQGGLGVDFEIDPRDPEHVFLVMGNSFGRERLFETTNAGLEWRSVAAGVPLNGEAYSLAVDWQTGIPTLYLATDRGVFANTGPGSEAWLPYGDGLPHTTVWDLELLSGARILTAGTFGRGVFQIQLPSALPISGQLDPASDSGISDHDGITFVTQPTFLGATRPGTLVDLIARAEGSSSEFVVGMTTADALGAWQVVTAPLSDGQYTVLARATNPINGFQTTQTLLPNAQEGMLTIDTQSPRVVAFAAIPRQGRLFVTMQDALSGLAQPALFAPGNYTLRRAHRGTNKVLAVSTSPPSVADAPQVVVLKVAGQVLRPGTYGLQVASGGVEDVAGNALAGHFAGFFPTGRARANHPDSGSFRISFESLGQRVSFPRPLSARFFRARRHPPLISD